MGNNSSNRRRNSSAAEYTAPVSSTPSAATSSVVSPRDFNKSVSMPALADKKRESTKTKKRNLTGQDGIRRSESNKFSNGCARQRSIRREISHPISSQFRDIISQCFDNPHSEFGNKVCQRVFEKRTDYQNYVYSLGKERAFQMTQRLKDLVERIIQRIDDVEFISTTCRQYGEEHVEMKGLGFKPDFWVGLADAITIEGVILDMANHQPADTVAAWSSLVSLMFSAVRDGYYSALRQFRMNSRRNLIRQQTIESTQGSMGGNSSRQNSLNGKSMESGYTSFTATDSAPRGVTRFD